MKIFKAKIERLKMLLFWAPLGLLMGIIGVYQGGLNNKNTILGILFGLMVFILVVWFVRRNWYKKLTTEELRKSKLIYMWFPAMLVALLSFYILRGIENNFNFMSVFIPFLGTLFVGCSILAWTVAYLKRGLFN